MSNQTITPNSGALKLSLSSTVAVAYAALALSGAAPVLSMSGQNVTIVPNSGTLIVTTAGLTSQVITPNAGALSLIGQAPSVNAVSSVIAPNAGSLAFSGAIPLQTLTLLPPAAGNLALTGVAPLVTVYQAAVITPSAGALNLAGNYPGINGVFPVINTSALGGSGISYDDAIGNFSGISGPNITRDKSITRNLT